MILTASAAIISGKRILLVKRRSTAVLFPGYWAFPGGRSEPGETPEEIAVREVKEETGLDFTPSSLLLTSHFDDRKMHRFIGSWSGNVVLQEEELSDFGWFKYEEALDLPLAFDYEEVLHRLFEKGLIE